MRKTVSDGAVTLSMLYVPKIAGKILIIPLSVESSSDASPSVTERDPVPVKGFGTIKYVAPGSNVPDFIV